MKIKHIKLYIGVICAIVIIVTASLNIKNISKKFYPNTASSATYYDLHGQAWSDNIGWISFNCLEGSPSGASVCDTSSYKVTTDATGLLSGYAWSDNIGWISFNETTGCPTAPCRGSLTAGGLTGWARVIAPFTPANPPTIPVEIPHPDRGGWDGWIELNHPTGVSPFSVTRSGNDLGGQAWGDINVGWISFNCNTGGLGGADICTTSNYKVYVTATTIPDPTLDFIVPSHVYTSATTTHPVTWNTTNTSSCYASSSWSGPKSVPSGNENIGPFPSEGGFIYGITCYNYVYNLHVSASRPINVTNGLCDTGENVPGNPYDCTSIVNRFEANPKIVKEGKSSKLEWNIAGAQSCKLYSPTNVLLVNIPNGNQVGTYIISNITEKSTYRISCLGNVNSYATVSVYLLYEQ